MQLDERAVRDPSEGNTEQGDEAPAPATSLVLADEGVSEVDNSVRGAGPESAKKQYVEEQPSPESDEVANEDREAFDNPVAIATHFEFRSAAAAMTPPSASLRARSRRGKQASPMRSTAAGDAGQAGSDAAVLGASSSSAPATGTHADVPAMANVDQGAAPGDDKKLKRACSAPRAMVAIAQASPPDSDRRMPWRSRKQYSPKRFVIAAVGAPSAAAPLAGDAPPSAAIPGSTLPSASASGLRTEISGVIDASASSSNHPPSRGRKKTRPEHFIPEEAAATASAKARRSDIVLDRFLSSLVHGSSASASEWVSNVTAKDVAIRGDRQSGVEGFRIRDVGRHAARASGLRAALSRLGASSGGPFSSASAAAPAPGSPPGEPDGRGRFYSVLAVLGASLALSVVSCVLFYIVGQRSEPGPSGEMPDE